MKIAHLVSTFYPRVGGMGEVCRQEVELLSRKGADVTVFTLHYPGVRRSEGNNSYSVQRSRSLIRLGDGGELPQLLWQLKKFDVIHLHYPFYGAGEWVWLNKLLYHKPYVVTYHMDADPGSFIAKKLQYAYDNIWARRILQGANKVITIDRDHFSHTTYAKDISADKVVEILNAVNTEIFHPTKATWKDLGLAELTNRPTLLFVGNFLPFKRFDLVCEALKLLPNEVILVAVGNGYERNSYHDQVKAMGLANRVLFYGRCIDKHKLADLYSAADCLVVASDRAESFSLTALESLACATPVIASNIPGVRSRIIDGQDGFLFSPGDCSDLTNKISKLLSLTPFEREMMGNSGRTKILSEYTWSEHLKKLQTVYSELL